MAKSTYHQPIGEPRPKRGDLIHTNVGDRRERTWLVLRTQILKNRICEPMGGIMAQRTKIWRERWWALEPEMRVALYRSAERAGGQLMHESVPFPVKRKPTFEQHMRRKTSR
jgi:hypothetical protein